MEYILLGVGIELAIIGNIYIAVRIYKHFK